MTPPAATFTIKDAFVENQRPLKVRVIGAGYSGIYLGIRIPQRLRNVDLKIYEKNDGVGGDGSTESYLKTWWENRYPGCACDIPAHSYQYTFNPNPNWSAFYAPAEEICAYLTGVAEKYGVLKHLELSQKVVDCRWDDTSKKWKIKVEKTKTGEIFDDDADILISAKGALNEISWPAITGLDKFEGEIMHSAAWNTSYDFKNQRVGIIGGGSSSIQIVPKLQPEVSKLSCFVRSKTWISDPFGVGAMQKLGMDPKELVFSQEQRDAFSNDPQKYLEFRKVVEGDGNTIHDITILDSALQKYATQACIMLMKHRLAKKPEIIEKLIPQFGVGCRRLTPGPGYLEALVEDNVDFIPDKIAFISHNGIVLENGNTIELDAIVCATGFKVLSTPPFPIVGRNNVNLEERFKPYPKTYLSIGLESFPNFFMMLGPNSGIGAGSLTTMIETQGDYIVKCIRKLQKEDYVTMEPKAERVEDFQEIVAEYFKKTVYLDKCHSWYRSDGGAGDRIVGLWPGGSLHFLETMRSPRWEDFQYESSERNELRWLGDGMSTAMVPDGDGDPAWYIDPRFVSFPAPSSPENDEEYKMRPYSH